MAHNYGKKFEEKFKENMLKVPGVCLDRLPDQFTGYKNTSSNISDFLCYRYPNLAYIEVKCCYGNTFNFANLRQYDKLLAKKGIKGVHAIVIIWFIDHDKVIAFPIETIEKMKIDKLKSINIKTYQNYSCIDIPSQKKRVFMDSDYRYLFDYLRQVDNGREDIS